MIGDDRLLKMGEVLEIVAVGETQLRQMIAEGRFPKGVWIGVRSVRWRASDVQRWIDELQVVEGAVR